MKRYNSQLAPGGVTDSAPETAALDVTRLLTTITDNLVGMIYRCRVDVDWTMEYVSEGCQTLRW